jgi:hypothetical protein
MKSNTIKAIRATIALGDVELEVYQLPCGKYLLGATHITSAIGIRHSRVAQISATKYAQALTGKGIGVADFTSTPVITDIGKGKGYSIEVAFFIWQYEAFKGNELAAALTFASGVEALERRADAAFGKIRTEQERNDRLIIRRDGIISRHFWTDCIDTYCRSTEVSENYRRWVYIQVSDMVNKSILGTTAKQYRESLGLPDGVSTRDYLNTEQLKQIDTIEKAAGMRVTRDGLCPKQALKDVISLIG